MMYVLLAVSLFLLVMAYLASVVYLMNYLRRVHTATWAQLGRPSFPPFSADVDERMRFAKAGFLTLWFIFSSRYKTLADAQLNSLVWRIRLLSALIICLLPVEVMLGPR